MNKIQTYNISKKGDIIPRGKLMFRVFKMGLGEKSYMKSMSM